MKAMYLEGAEVLGRTVTVQIDRPMGHVHKNGIFYPLNYGFILGTVAEDGEEMDI